MALLNPNDVTKDTTLGDIEKIVDQLEDVLKKAGLPFDRPKLTDDLKKRVADLNNEDVTTWESRQTAAAAKPKKKEKPLPDPEPLPEGMDRKEAVVQRLRGASAKIDPNFFYISDENDAIVKTWIALRKSGVVTNLLSVGPSGCGKTEGLKRASELHGLPFYKVDCASITTSDKWYGHKEVIATADGPQTQYIASEHLRWLSADGCEPGLLVYDEINRLPPQLLNALIPILDGSQKIWVPDLGVYVNVHPDTMIAATANLGVGYSGTYGLDIAMHDRFGVMMEMTFPPEEKEAEILIKRTGIDQVRAEALIKVATRCRQMANAGDLSKFVSTRALLDWGRWVTTGMSMTDAAEATWVKKFSEEGGSSSERAKVRTTIQGICSGK